MVNGLKARIARHEALYGIFVMLPSPDVVEMVGYAGFDYVVLDAEHGPLGPETLENQLRAADAAGIPALVRVGSPSPDRILRALDGGAAGILVPHVTSARDAEAAVRAAHFPPRGIRGMASTSRAGRHGFVTPKAYHAHAAQETVVIVQIEDAEALSEVGAIAQVRGVDAVFAGPSDLATSMGHPGEIEHPDVAAALAGILRDVRAVSNTGLAHFARDEEEARRLVGQGFPMICLSTTTVFSRRLAGLVKGLKGQA